MNQWLLLLIINQIKFLTEHQKVLKTSVQMSSLTNLLNLGRVIVIDVSVDAEQALEDCSHMIRFKVGRKWPVRHEHFLIVQLLFDPLHQFAYYTHTYECRVEPFQIRVFMTNVNVHRILPY